jgi:hypothetical protein
MTQPGLQMSFFLDNNISDRIGAWLSERGHDVALQRKHILADAPDLTVAATAMAAGRILVTQDKDFNSQRFQKARFAALSRIGLVGGAHQLLPALAAHMHLIEFQWAWLLSHTGSSLIAFVKPGGIRFRTVAGVS